MSGFFKASFTAYASHMHFRSATSNVALSAISFSIKGLGKTFALLIGINWVVFEIHSKNVQKRTARVSLKCKNLRSVKKICCGFLYEYVYKFINSMANWIILLKNLF